MILNISQGGSPIGVLDPFAVIKVNYPTGSSCTCSKGATVFHAKDTSGEVFFGVPEAGDWVITATDGTETTTKTISITTQYQVETASLAYVSGYLFKEGDGAIVTLTPYTENTTQVGRSIATISNENIRLHSMAGVYTFVSNASVYTDAMDITSLSMLYIEHSGRCHACIDRMPDTSSLMDETSIHGASDRSVASFDISSYTGSARFRILCTKYQTGAEYYPESATIYNWWTE